MATEDLEKETQTNRTDFISTLAMESVFHVFRSAVMNGLAYARCDVRRGPIVCVPWFIIRKVSKMLQPWL